MKAFANFDYGKYAKENGSSLFFSIYHWDRDLFLDLFQKAFKAFYITYLNDCFIEWTTKLYLSLTKDHMHTKEMVAMFCDPNFRV